jgi:hypothetical protein
VIKNNNIHDCGITLASHTSNGVFDNTVDHNGSNLIRLYSGKATDGVTAILGLSISDNSWRTNTYGIAGDHHAGGSDSLNFYAPGATVVGNAFAGGVAKNVKLTQRADNQVLLYWATKE